MTTNEKGYLYTLKHDLLEGLFIRVYQNDYYNNLMGEVYQEGEDQPFTLVRADNPLDLVTSYIEELIEETEAYDA